MPPAPTDWEILESFSRGEAPLVARVRVPGGSALLKTFASGAADELRRELECMRDVASPRLTRVLDAGSLRDGRAYLLREFVDGENLRQRLPSLSLAQRQQVVVDVCLALSDLHRSGIIHGDLKPENVLLAGDSSQVKLTDFALSEWFRDADREEPGAVRGSAYYLPPERLLGYAASARSDLFSLGVLCFELLATSLPADPREFYARFPHRPFLECVDAAALPEVWRPLIARLTVIEPMHRPLDVFQVLEELQELGWSVVERRTVPPQLPADLALRPLRRPIEALVAEPGRTVPHVELASPEEEEVFLQEMRFLAALRGWEERDDLPREPAARDFLVLEASEDVLRRLGPYLLTHAVRCVLWSRPGQANLVARRSFVRRLGAPVLLPAEVAAELVGRYSTLPASLPLLRFGEELVRVTKGSVVRCNQVLARWFHAGHMSREHGTWRLDSLHPLRDPVPEGAAGEPTVLSPNLRKVLPYVLLAGPRLRTAVLASICRRVRVSAQQVRAELEAAHLLLPVTGGWLVGDGDLDGASPEEVCEVHAVLAEIRAEEGDWMDVLRHHIAAGQKALAGELVVARGEELSRRATDQLVQLLEELMAGDTTSLPPAVLLAVARLFLRAGRYTQVVEVLRPAQRPRRRSRGHAAGVLQLLGEAYSKLSQLEDADKVLQAGYRRFRGTPFETPFVRGLAELHLRRGRPRAVVTLVDAWTQQSRDPAEPVALELANLRALAQLRMGATQAAGLTLRKALSVARSGGHPGHLSMLLTNLWSTLRQEGRLEDAISCLEEALAIQQDLGQYHELSIIHNNLGISLKELLRFDEARYHLETSLELRTALGDSRGRAVTLASLGILALDQGALQQAEGYLADAREQAAALGEPRERLLIRLAGFRLELLAGRWRGWTRRMQQLIRDAEAAEVLEVVVEAALLLGERLLGSGRLEEVHEQVVFLDRLIGENPSHRLATRLHLLRAGFHIAVGDESGARPWLERARQLTRGDRGLSAVLLMELLLEGQPTESLLDRLEGAARAAHDRRSEVEAKCWRERWHELRGDRFGREAVARSRAEVLTQMQHADGGSGMQRVWIACLATSRRQQARWRRQKRRQQGDENVNSSPSSGENWQLLRTFLTINKRLSLESDPERLLEYIVETGVALSGAQRGFVVLEGEDEERIQVSKSLRGELESPLEELSLSFVREAWEKGHLLVTSNAGHDPRFRDRKSVSRLELRSILCVPFTVDPGSRGALYLDNPIREGAFGDREVELVDALADQTAIGLRHLRSRRKAEVRSRELEGAVRRQESSLALAERALGREGIKDPGPDAWLGSSPAFQEVRRLVERYASSELSVLITGESGTGKELVARQIHLHSARAHAPFVSESCSSIPETLLEAEFFGVKKGAFTGADRDREGLFRLADGGTLFLDECGELPEALQAKLLRALEERRVRPVGGAEPIAVDFRMVTATNRDLDEAVRLGTFRQDLYYRINAAVIHLPPLRERSEDVPELALHFLARLNAEHERHMTIPDAVLRAMQTYSWPGNIRQLRNEVERAFALSEGEVIEWNPPAHELPSGWLDFSRQRDLNLREIEQQVLREALRRTEGNKENAAKLVGISRASMYERCRRFAEDPESGSPSRRA